MQRGKSLPLGQSSNYFKTTAIRTHRFNVSPRPMRGGIRL